MPAPELTHTGQRLYEALAPLAEQDEQNDYALAHYCGALATVLDQLADLSRDTDEVPGWGAILDPNLVPVGMIPYLAQFVGVQVPQGLAEGGSREWLRHTDGRSRGTPAALEGAAKPYLTGAKRVLLVERHGTAYALQVSVWADDTPDPAAAEAAVRAQKPAGIVLTFSVLEGGDYQTLRDTHTDYADLKATFTDYADLRAEPQRT